MALTIKENPYPLINCPSCGGGNEATVRMDKDDNGICAVWHCNLCAFEWVHESSRTQNKIPQDRLDAMEMMTSDARPKPTASEILREVLSKMTPRPWIGKVHDAPERGQNRWRGRILGRGKDVAYTNPHDEQDNPDVRGIVILVNCANEFIALVEEAEKKGLAACAALRKKLR